MTIATAILGKGGVGKTLVAAHLAMAFSYLGVRTLLVGCDQKRDTHRAVGAPARPCLMEACERCGGNPEEVNPAALVAAASKYVDVLELGPSRLVVGDYAAVYEASFRSFQRHGLLGDYDQVLFDVTDERFDAPNLPLFRTLDFVVGVTDDQPESLFVLNRMLRGMLIGWNEFGLPARVVGAVSNRDVGAGNFERYVERTRAVPLLRLPAAVELAELRTLGTTLFAGDALPRELDALIDGFLKIVGLLQAGVYNLLPVLPLSDEEVWSLARFDPPRN